MKRFVMYFLSGGACAIVLAFLLLGVNGSESVPQVTTAAATETTWESMRIASLEEEVAALRADLARLETDPRFLLLEMDFDLDAIEKGEEPRGSFTDYFVVNAGRALEMGASRQEIEARVDRLIALADKGIYLSTFVERLVKEGGTNAVRQYVKDCIGL